MGVAYAFGCLATGLIVVRANANCTIGLRYLCQMTSFGCGAILILFTVAEGFKSYALFAFAYGLMGGAYAYSLKVFACEVCAGMMSFAGMTSSTGVTSSSESLWGYATLAQVLSTLLGPSSSGG